MLSRNRVDEEEFWNSASSSENNSWRRTLIGETYQMAIMQGTPRSKRQNCGNLVQGHQNNMNVIYGSEDHLLSGSNRINQEGEASVGHGSRPVFSGFHGVMDQSNRKVHQSFSSTGSSGPGSGSTSSFTFPAGNGRLETLMENNNAMLEGMVAICNPASQLQSARCADLSPMSTYRNIDGSSALNGSVVEVEAPFSRVIFNQGHTVLEGSNFIPSVCMTPTIIPVPDEEAARFSVSGLIGSSVNNPDTSHGNTSRGRRNFCKRKSSMAEITGCVPGFNSCGLWEGNGARSVEGSGPGRFDAGNSICPDFDIFQSMNSDRMIPPWDNPQYFSNGDNTVQCLRPKLAFNGLTDSPSRYTGSRPMCMERRNSQSQLHASLVRNSRRMLASMPFQSWMSRRMPMNNQFMDPAANVDNAIVPHVDNQSTLAFNQNVAPPVSGTWYVNSTYPPGSNIDHSVFAGPARESIPGTLEVNQLWNSSTGAANWLGIPAVNSWYPNHGFLDPTGRALPGMTNRALHAREFHSGSINTGTYTGSVGSRSSANLAGVSSSRRNTFHSQGRLHHTTSTSSNSVARAVSANSYAFPESVNGPCPPAMPSLFLPGEGAISSSMHNLLRMPFRGLQILPAEGGNRQRFASEDLLDIHDQHSDMRLDVDNMSYEELLALEERIGDVKTGLTDENIAKCLKLSKHSTSNVTVNAVSQESEIKCSICQEEYQEADELGKLDCGHVYHVACIKQWLVQKNQCPICKATAYAES